MKKKGFLKHHFFMYVRSMHAKVIIGMVVGVAVVGATWVFIARHSGNDNTDATNQVVSLENAAAVKNESAEGLIIDSGQKKVSVHTQYEDPAGTDEVEFSVIVDTDDTIVDASVNVLASHDISQKRQEAFAEALPEAVKGKKLRELAPIETIGGSALTTEAFNESLDDLKSQL